jgi:mRNA-degrading endonuclease YafQ of YafQ-DinJ toxin-antitoxin module
MYHLKVSKNFEQKLKKFIKNNSALRSILKEKLKILKENPFDPSLKTHKLSGPFKDFYSFWLTYEYRIVVKIYPKEKLIEFYAIGTHDEVY